MIKSNRLKINKALMKSIDHKYWYQAEDIMSLLRDQQGRTYDLVEPVPNNEAQATQDIKDAIENLQEARPTAIPFKIDEKHFAGLVLRKLDDGGISAHYYDPSASRIPTFLDSILKSSGVVQVYSHSPARRQGAEYDCGPWTVSSLHDMATAKNPFPIPNLLQQSAKKTVEPQRRRLAELIIKAQIDQQIRHIRNEFFPESEGRENSKSILGEFADTTHTRDASDSNNERVTQLNLVSKLFTKVPYSALLEGVNDTSKTYLSLPNESKLDTQEIHGLLDGLQAVIENPTDQDCKRDLFIKMLKTKNSLLIDYIIRGPGKDAGIRKIAERALSAGKTSADGQIKTGATESDFKSEQFKKFVNAHFNAIFPPEKLERLNLRGFNIEVLPSSYETKTHVEMRGASYLHSKGIQNLNIGLSNSKNEEPTCCAGCTVERMAVQEVLGLTLHVSATSSDNFPPASYNPSSFTDNPAVCNEFSLQIETVLREKYQTQTKTEDKDARLNLFSEERKKLSELIDTLQDLSKSQGHNISNSAALEARQILGTLGDIVEQVGTRVSPTSTPVHNTANKSPNFSHNCPGS